MRTSIILAIMLIMATGQMAAAATTETDARRNNPYANWFNNYIEKVLSKNKKLQAIIAEEEQGSGLGYESVRMRSDGRITDINGKIIAVPIENDPRNTNTERYYQDADADGKPISGTDFYVIYDKEAGYVKKSTEEAPPSTQNTMNTQNLQRAGDVFSTGQYLDKILGDTPDKLNALKKIAAESGGQYSEQTIRDYEIYLAAASGRVPAGATDDEREIIDYVSGMISATKEAGDEGNVNTQVNASTGQTNYGGLNDTNVTQLQQSTGLTADEIKQVGYMLNSGTGGGNNAIAEANKKVEQGVAQLVDQLKPRQMTRLTNRAEAASDAYKMYEQRMGEYTNLVNQYKNGTYSPQQTEQLKKTAQSYLDSAQGYYQQYTGQVAQLNVQLGNVVNGQMGQITQMVTGAVSGIVGMGTQAISQYTQTLTQSATSMLSGAIGSAVSGVTNTVGGVVNGVTGAVGGAVSGATNAVGGAVSSATGGALKGLSINASGTFSSESFGSGMGNGNVAYNVAGDFNSSNGNAQEAERKLNGYNPANMPHEFLASDKKNMTMLCEETPYDKSTGNNPVTQYVRSGSCLKGLNQARLGQEWGNTNPNKPSVPTAKKGATDSNGMIKVDVEQPGNGLDSWSKVYDQSIKNAKILLQNYSGREALLMRDSTSSTDTDSQVFTKAGAKRVPYSNAYNDEKAMIEDGVCQMIQTEKDPAYTISPKGDGRTYKVNSTLGKGAGKGKVTAPKSSGSGGGFNANVQSITDPSHPFAPRHLSSWQERQSPSYDAANQYNDANENGNGVRGTQYSYTFVCGRKDVYPPMNSNKKAWEDGFDYYKKPQESKRGSIFVDMKRNVKATVTFQICWQVGKLICDMYGSANECYVAVIHGCEDMMCRSTVLPPVDPSNRIAYAYNNAPEGPDTARGSRNNTSGTGGRTGGAGGMSGGGMSGGGMSGGAGGMGGGSGSGNMSNDQSIPYIYEENREGYSGDYKTEGFSWYYAQPEEKFGYNGPPLAFHQTGLPASKAVLDHIGCDPSKKGQRNGSGCKDLEKLEYWRTAVVGVNNGYDAEGTLDMSEEAHNMSGQYGGWNELQLYQGRCINKGYNCICNQDKVNFDGTALGHVLREAGGDVYVDAGPKLREKKATIPNQSGYKDYARNPLDAYAVDESKRVNSARNLPISLNNKAFKPMMGYEDANGKKFPFNVPHNKLKRNLDNAEKGNIVIWQEETNKSNIPKRPYFAGIVRDKREDGCLVVGTSNNGVIIDSAGNTENAGNPTERIICKSGGGGGGALGSAAGAVTGGVAGGAAGSAIGSILGGLFKIEGLSSVGGGGANDSPSCVNVNVRKCTDYDWNEYYVWDWDGDEVEVKDASGIAKIERQNYDDRSFNPVTGKCTGSSC